MDSVGIEYASSMLASYIGLLHSSQGAGHDSYSRGKSLSLFGKSGAKKRFQALAWFPDPGLDPLLAAWCFEIFLDFSDDAVLPFPPVFPS